MRLLPQLALLGAVAVPVSVTAADEIDFARDIRPILSENCIYCHGPDEEHREAGLRLDLKEDAFADRDGVIAFVPGDLEKSESWYRIVTDDEDDLMPPPKSNKKLTAEQKDLAIDVSLECNLVTRTKVSGQKGSKSTASPPSSGW